LRANNNIQQHQMFIRKNMVNGKEINRKKEKLTLKIYIKEKNYVCWTEHRLFVKKK